jgi:hypothetical protein
LVVEWNDFRLQDLVEAFCIGGIIEDSDDTQEGSLTWDELKFPEPTVYREKLART